MVKTNRHSKQISFYACKIDPVQPERIFGGTQDQGVLRTITGGIDDFEEVLSGDGFRVLVDPSDNNIVYAERPFGELYRSEQGGQDFSCIYYCSQNGFEDVDQLEHTYRSTT
ncbi:MAG: hypothetical protein R2788_17365 [Saprospiraceae bacterium]